MEMFSPRTFNEGNIYIGIFRQWAWMYYRRET